ncbi:capsular biosynthesis protein [Neokomagataea thailandica NBRC 106555]|uniref:DUF4422 domain-containing protein n=2 Tax=Neokomagataea TaxID=1223423 RepID=A0A4Y6V4I7_9PROT|nr:MULTISPECIES: DUF4422 domain-containing protein [Neokomagataea]QDH24843.1 DUF4422 domain-containing protein [Neokomagataea tanensis]GBR50125.1 capsular biosynthesis protein [Neokomagataea thailandica NBRC 106555]
MRVKIFSCHYKTPAKPVNNELFADILSGAKSDPDGHFIGDLDGENISEQNVFSEIRHHYYVWKNLLDDYEYIGFDHYRRRFFITPMPFEKLNKISPHFAGQRDAFDADQKLHEIEQSREDFLEHLNIRDSFSVSESQNFKNWLSQYDVIVPRMWHLHDRPDLESEWKNSGLPPQMWELFMEAMRNHKQFLPLPHYPVRTSNHNSIFIMKTELFDEYMSGLFGTIKDLEALMEGKIHHFPRMWGYVAEKALNYFILAQRKKNPFFNVAQLPLIVRTIHDDL